MRRTVVSLVAGLVGVGCSGWRRAGRAALRGHARGGTASASSSAPVSGDLTVLAAASLTESFTTLGKQFEAANPGVKVTFGFAASSALATQITSGAPADVFASASTTTMDAVVAAGAAADPKPFAQNVMEIAVPPANPGKVTGIGSLASADVKTALCQPQVPCGSTAAEGGRQREAHRHAGHPRARRQVGAQQGAARRGRRRCRLRDRRASPPGTRSPGIEIPAGVNAATRYPIAALTTSANPAAAAAFVEYVLSPAGASVLTAAGFQQP